MLPGFEKKGGLPKFSLHLARTFRMFRGDARVAKGISL